MTRKRSMAMLLVVFFCTSGWIYADSASEEVIPALAEVTAVAADEAASVDDASAAEIVAAAAATIKVANAPVPESLFDAADEEPPIANVLPVGQSVAVSAVGEIELHVEGQDINKILTLLSRYAHRNILASKSVSGTISADLYGVDFYEAMDAILHANGFGYEERGNCIYVYTAEELAERQRAERRPITSVKRLNYMTAADASAFVTPLLSDRGSIAISGEASAGFQPSISDGGANGFAYADTLVIRDFQENVDEILAVLTELDRRPRQVLIEATILEARLTEDNAFGVDLSIVLDNNLGIFSDPLNVVDSMITGAVSDGDPVYERFGNSGGIQSTVGNVAQGKGGFKFGYITKNVAAFVRAMDRVTDTTVVAKPTLMVLNRQRANLLVGAKLGYLSTTATETSTTQTIEFLEVGTQLTVRPFVSDDGFVRLEIKPSVSDGVTSQVGSFVIPNQTSNEMQTNIMVRSGQTIVLGGLFKEDTAVTREQVPLAGDLPIVGNAFKGRDDVTKRTEVIFLITPTVMKDESMYAAGETVRNNIETVGMGARNGLLPWSRSKQTAAHMQKAVDHYERGENDKALLYTKMALSADPTFHDALVLKETITGKRDYAPGRSILKDMVDQVAREQKDLNAQVHPAPRVEPAAAAPAPKAEAVPDVPPPADDRQAATSREVIPQQAQSDADTAAAAAPVSTLPEEPIAAEMVAAPIMADRARESCCDEPASDQVTAVTPPRDEATIEPVAFHSGPMSRVRMVADFDPSSAAMPDVPSRGPSPKVVDAVSRWLPQWPAASARQ